MSRRTNVECAYAFWGRSTGTSCLRGVLAGGIRYPSDAHFRIPRVSAKPNLRLAVYGRSSTTETSLLDGLVYDSFNAPCNLGVPGELVDYLQHPTPMLNEPYVSVPRENKKPLKQPPILVNASSAEKAIFHAVAVG